MACVCGAAVVVTFTPTPDVRLAAVWDGGPWCSIHVVEHGAYTVAVDRWYMVDGTGEPHIPCTPGALAELVATRVSAGAIPAELLELAEDYAAWHEPRATPRAGAPDFSTN